VNARKDISEIFVDIEGFQERFLERVTTAFSELVLCTWPML